MNFVTRAKVRFADVDAAGIAFYPRYFVMLNAAVEDWFEGDLGMTFAELHLRAGIGVPTVKLECDFSAPSFLGEILDVTLCVRKVGRTSCAIDFRMAVEGVDRLAGRLVIVCMDLKKHKAVAWPECVRAGMERSLVPA